MGVYDFEGNALFGVYDCEGYMLNNAYDHQGNEIQAQHFISSNYTASLMFDLSDIAAGTQGLAADSLSDELAQLYTGKIYMIDAETGSHSQVADSFNLLHGGAGQFKPTKEDPADEYPLLYVSGGQMVNDGTNYYSCLLEVKIANGSSTLQRVFVADEGVTYGGHFAIDFANSVAYHVFSEKYKPDSGEVINYTYIHKWDMTSYEAVTPISLNPRNGYYKFNHLLDSFTIPYVAENQSVTFADGLIALLSDASSGSVVFVDPINKDVYLTISEDMPSGEIEGIAFLHDDMVLCARNNSTTNPSNVYYRYQFD